MIKLVIELPPKLSWRSRVNLDSLYGTIAFLFSLKVCITFPKVERLVLIFLASSKAFPSDPVLDSF